MELKYSEDKEINQLQRLTYLYQTLDAVMKQPYSYNAALVDNLRNNIQTLNIEKIKALREMTIKGKDVEESQLANIDVLPQLPSQQQKKRELILKNESKELEIILFFDNMQWPMSLKAKESP